MRSIAGHIVFIILFCCCLSATHAQTGFYVPQSGRIFFGGDTATIFSNVLVLGNNNPGVINGYDADRYLVTANSPGNGLLLRENITVSDGLVVFPIGSKPNAYTPGAVQSSVVTGDDYYMGVFDSVKSNATSGLNLEDSSVNKTWEVGKINRPDLDEAYVYFQHLVADEGSVFAARRSGAYVSRYTGSGWDSTMQMATPATGFLTTGSPLTNSGVNNRLVNGLIGSSTYFTKFTSINEPLPVETKAWLNAYRTDWKQVKVYWTTKPEIDQDYFVVQCRLSTESEFYDIDIVKSKAPNGSSINYLNYSIMDENPHTGISYYRLLLVNLRNEQAFSNMVAVKGKPSGYQLLIWPNPTRGRFFVGISGAAVVKSIMIWDIMGRKIREEKVGERSIIELHMFIPGTYMISFVGAGGEILETKKLLVQPY